MDIIDAFDKFMSSNIRNEWIEDYALRVYVRKGSHLIDGELVKTIDIANIQSAPEYQHNGYFRSFMRHVESYKVPVYVENIHNPLLTDILVRNGYRVIDPEALLTCVIKTIT